MEWSLYRFVLSCLQTNKILPKRGTTVIPKIAGAKTPAKIRYIDSEKDIIPLRNEPANHWLVDSSVPEQIHSKQHRPYRAKIEARSAQFVGSQTAGPIASDPRLRVRIAVYILDKPRQIRATPASEKNEVIVPSVRFQP